MDPIYLDHNATSPLRPAVLDAMLGFQVDELASGRSREHCLLSTSTSRNRAELYRLSR